jgi:hypothetical protein
MKSFEPTHLVLLMATVAFVALTMFLASKLPRRWQNVLFIAGAVLCAGGILWRYGFNMSLSPLRFHADTLLIQMLQVCNFNLVLVLLMLVPKFELARQYSIMFSMFAAATVMLSIPSRFANDAWYSPDFLNFWLNHVFAIALPLWMLAAGRLKPQKKYILPVAGCVVAYFLIVYGCTEWLHAAGKLAESTTFSYVYDPAGVGLLEWMYKLIPVPCFYLAPLIPPMLGFFWGLVWLLRKYAVVPYAKKTTK